MIRSVLTLILLPAVVAGCAALQPGSDPVRMMTARVVDSSVVSKKASWAPGAIVGGVVGLASGSGHSTESKVIRSAAGAAAGAGVNHILTSGKTSTRLVLQTASNELIEIEHSSNDLRLGDCVSIHSYPSGKAKVFRTSPTQCTF